MASSGDDVGAVSANSDAIAAQVGMLSQQSTQIRRSATNLAAAAGSGFHIEPEAAATLILACQNAIHQLNGLGTAMFTISQAPPLGTTPVAKVVAPFTQQVATDHQGIKPAIDNLKQTLNDMIDAYRKASTNYAETEAAIAAALEKTKPKG